MSKQIQVAIRTFQKDWPSKACDQDGHTLIELLVASLLAVLLLSGALTLLQVSQEVEARDTTWALTLREGRVGLARMAFELREARKVAKAEAGAITFFAPIGGKLWEVEYSCSVAQTGTTYDQCTRYAVEDSTEETKSLPSTGTAIVRDVLNGTSVFSYKPSSSEPTIATMKVELPAKGTLKQAGSSSYNDHIVLENAAFMRTLDPAG